MREICFYAIVDSSKEEPDNIVSISLTRSDARWTIQNIIGTARQKQMRIARGCGRLDE